MTESIRVVVADDHPLFREGVITSLQSQPDIVVVGEAADAILIVDENRYHTVLKPQKFGDELPADYALGKIRNNGQAAFEGAGLRVALERAAASDGRAVVCGVRPEHFTIADDGAEATIQVIEPTGSEIQVVAKLGGADVIAVFRERHQFKPGDKIRLKPDPRLVHLFDAESGKRLNG